jgi:uncharacterized protein YjiS (DUF1127 family)
LRSKKAHQSDRPSKGSATGPWGADFPSSSRVCDNPDDLKVFGGGAEPDWRSDATSGFDVGASGSVTVWARRLCAVARRAWASWRRELEYARAIKQLQQLDDRRLRDIGIEHRSEIDHLVRFGRKGR